MANLDNLPTNVILNVAARLLPRSAACLSLTSRNLHDGHKALRMLWIQGFDSNQNHCGCERHILSPCPPLKMVNHEKYLFLQMLARDLGHQYQLCDLCVKLHHHDESTRTSCLSWQLVLSLRCLPGFNVQPKDAQRAMNLYRSGASPESALRRIGLSRDWLVEKRKYSWSGSHQITQITKLDVEPRIIAGNLMIQTRQHVLITHAIMNSLSQGDSDFSLGKYVAGLVSACSHWGCILQVIRGVDDSMTELESNRQQESIGYKFIGTVARSCCLTEITLANHYIPRQGNEIVLTTWTNLGPCEWGWQINRQNSHAHLGQGAQRTKTSPEYPSEYDSRWVGGQDCSRWLLGSKVPEKQTLTPTAKSEAKSLAWIAVIVAWVAMLLAWLSSLMTGTRRVSTPRSTSQDSHQNTRRINHMALEYFQHDRQPIPAEKLEPPIPVPSSTWKVHTTVIRALRPTTVPSSRPSATNCNNNTIDAPPSYDSLSHDSVPTTPIRPNARRRGWTNKVRESCRAWKKKALSKTRSSKQKKVAKESSELGYNKEPHGSIKKA